MADQDREVEAVAAVRAHHAVLAARLDELVEALLAAALFDPGLDGAAASGAQTPTVRAARALASYATGELLPHAVAEEGTLYRAAAERAPAGLLVSGMLVEHRVLADLVAELGAGTDTARLAGTARALQVLFAVHLGKENDLILPLLAEDPTVSIADLLAGMHELLGAES